jgi:Inner membrane component of T3SS, cytoplasmic domain
MAPRAETTVLELPLVLDTGARTDDVVLEATPDTPGETVLAQLAAHMFGNGAADPRVRCVRTGRSLRPDLPLAAAGLLRGDRLLVGDVARVRAAADDAPERTAWDLVVVGGPAAGRRFPLVAGEIVVGSDAACDLTIDDPALSGRHVLIRADGAQVEVEDAGSRNGTALDGVSVPGGESRRVGPGSIVRAGRTLIAVEHRAADEVPATVRPDGTLAFNRPPRVSPPFEPVPTPARLDLQGQLQRHQRTVNAMNTRSRLTRSLLLESRALGTRAYRMLLAIDARPRVAVVVDPGLDHRRTAAARGHLERRRSARRRCR